MAVFISLGVTYLGTSILHQLEFIYRNVFLNHSNLL